MTPLRCIYYEFEDIADLEQVIFSWDDQIFILICWTKKLLLYFYSTVAPVTMQSYIGCFFDVESGV